MGKRIGFSIPNIGFYGVLSLGLLAIIVAGLNIQPIGSMSIMLIPFALLIAIYLIKHPDWAMLFLCVSVYLIMGVTRYIPNLLGGIVIDALLIFVFIILIIRSFKIPFDWERMKNPLIFLSFAWFVYCLLEVLNPETTFTLWATSVRSIGVYFLAFVFLTFALFYSNKKLKIFLILWAILTLLAIVKVIIQKQFGFDSYEKTWLYIDGGSSTHIIHTGIRYFSFFTDAASFGCSMALSMVVFSICSMYIKERKIKILFIITALAACYGMFVSGTRAAIIIPFIAFSVFVVLSKQWKILIFGSFMIVAMFIFFNNTAIWQGNPEIRRMRSAFQGKKDASVNVRIENQKKMIVFMPDYPFGIGVGKAKHTEPNDKMYNLPTDSSIIFLWVETGIVGLIFYLLIFFYAIGRGIYDVLFRIQNLELKGILSALIAGLTGLLVASYGNEVLHQFPNGPLTYISMAFIFMGRYLDQELSLKKAEINE